MFWGLWFPHFELSGMVPLVRGLLGVVQSPIIKAMTMLLESLPELYELYIMFSTNQSYCEYERMTRTYVNG